MRIITPDEIEFARRAGKHFLAHPKHATYTDGEIEAGEWLAIRWGVEPEKADAVVVLRISDFDDPVIIGNLNSDREQRAHQAPASASVNALRGFIVAAIRDGWAESTSNLVWKVIQDSNMKQSEILTEAERMEREGVLERFQNPPGNRIGWRVKGSKS